MHFPTYRLPGGASGKNPPANAGDGRQGSEPRAWKSPCRKARPPTPVWLPGEAHGQEGLAGCSPRGRKELGMTAVT